MDILKNLSSNKDKTAAMKVIIAGAAMLASMIISQDSRSQTLEEGKKFMYYERYQSAGQVFSKLLAAKPDNEEAVYWLGQSMIAGDETGPKEIAAAKSLYLNKLNTNSSSALLLAGVGHIELLEGKNQDARSHFETAISLSQAKSIPVLNAIGFANGNPKAKNGDAAYAIDKLKKATEIKGFKDPDVWANMGDAYRKFADGGSAIQSYQQALRIDPNYARAYYRIGKVYETQGVGQEEVYMKYYKDAMAKDANYAPVYENLFNYYYSTNVPVAAQYMEKWLSVSDKDPKACYNRAQLLYVQGLFQESVKKADDCIAEEGQNAYPNLFGIKAFAYKRLNDSVKAKASFEEYFQKQLPEKIGPGDYAAYANVLLQFPGMEEQAGKNLEKAALLDSVQGNKVDYLKLMALEFEEQKKFKEAGDWYSRVLNVKPNITKTDLYKAGYSYFRGGDYNSSINIFNKYTEKFPDDMFGYYMIGKANAALDTTGKLGLAVPYYEKAIQIGEAAADKSKVKDQLMGSYKYFIEYNYNVKKDQAAALSFVEKALALDPADEQLIKNKEFIQKNDPARKPATPRPAGRS